MGVTKRSSCAGLFTGAALAAGLCLTAIPGAANAGPESGGTKTLDLPNVSVQGVSVDQSTDTAYVTADPRAGAGSVYAIDLATGTVAATITVGDQPGPVAVDYQGGNVYVANVADGTISEIDAVTNTVEGTISLPAGERPTAIAFDPQARLLFVGMNDKTTGSVAVYNPASPGTPTGTVTDAGTVVTDLAVDPGSTVFAAFASTSVHTIVGISTDTFSVDKVIKPAGIPYAIADDATTALDSLDVTEYGLVAQYNAYSGLPTGNTVTVDSAHVSSAANPVTGTVYNTELRPAGYYIDLINSSVTAVTGRIPVPGPGWIAVDEDTDTLVYAADVASNSSVSVIPLTAPGISGRASATFTTGKPGTFTVAATGTPAPRLTEAGRLPAGVSLSPAGTLSGTPKAGTGGVYAFTITAANGAGPAATQRFTLTVDEAPAIISADHFWFTHGKRATFTVRTRAFPVASLTERGALPRGMRFIPGKNGTATISGVPSGSARGRTYVITLTASNGVGKPAIQRLTLRVG
jgi:large repetitive protein